MLPLAIVLAPQRLIRVPEEREVPHECLLAIRSLSPRAEMVYVGNGMWWLGVVADEVPAMEEGWKLVAQCRRREAEGQEVRLASWRKALLMTQGFRLLAALGRHNSSGDPTPSECARALAPSLFTTDVEDEREQDARERASDTSAAGDADAEFWRGDEARRHYRDVYRTFRRTSITSRAKPQPVAGRTRHHPG